MISPLPLSETIKKFIKKHSFLEWKKKCLETHVNTNVLCVEDWIEHYRDKSQHYRLGQRFVNLMKMRDVPDMFYQRDFEKSKLEILQYCKRSGIEYLLLDEV